MGVIDVMNSLNIPILKNRWNTFAAQTSYLWLLFSYHLLFVVFAYLFRVQRGSSDAHLYWGYTSDVLQKPWWEYVNFGTDFMLFLTYPFLYIGLPFWFGFMLFGTIGFFGIRVWMKWIEVEVETSLQFKGWNVVPLVFFWPNLHFWTAGLGKEALVFWALATIFYKVSQKQFRSVVLGLALLVLILLRPHVALFLTAAFLIVQLFRSDLSLSTRLKAMVIALPIATGLVVVVLKLSKIRYIDWSRIERYNRGSVLSFDDSGSYVPMLDYSFFYQFISLFFRPFIWEAHSTLSFFAALDNLVLLLLHVFIGYLVLKYYRILTLSTTLKAAVLFSFICGSIYVFRYANLGIFMRTKIMWMPFLVGVFGYVVARVVKRR